MWRWRCRCVAESTLAKTSLERQALSAKSLRIQEETETLRALSGVTMSNNSLHIRENLRTCLERCFRGWLLRSSHLPQRDPHAICFTLRERLLDIVALRVRVRVAVLLRVRLLVGVPNLDPPPAERLEGEPVVEGAREGEPVGRKEGVVGLTIIVLLAETGREAEMGGERLTDGDAEEEEEPEEVSELELLEVPVWVEAAVAVGEEIADRVEVALADTDKAGEPDGVEGAVDDCVEAAVPDGVEETMGNKDEAAVPVHEVELLGVPLQETESLEVRATEELELPVCEGEGVCVWLEVLADVCDWLELRVPVPVALALPVSDCVDGAVPMAEELPVKLALGDGVPAAELEEEMVIVFEGLLVLVLEGLSVPVMLTLGVPVALVEPEGLTLKVEVSVGNALRRDAMLRSRKVMAERVASASPASHRLDSTIPLETRLEGMS